MFFKKKKQKHIVFDTRKEAMEQHFGITLTEQQFHDLCDINFMAISSLKDNDASMFVYYIMLVLDTLKLFSPEKTSDEFINIVTKYAEEERHKEFQKRFGKIKDC